MFMYAELHNNRTAERQGEAPPQNLLSFFAAVPAHAVSIITV
jgi:hypothetical protein